nr:DNA repair protein rad51c [Polyrhizophydium stewartii]
MLPGEQGIPTGKVTEICGMAGIGKTQLWYVPRNRVLLQQYVHSMQLCANVQIPTELQGLGGAALFIDTEGSFSAERFQDIAQATVAICNSCLAEDSEARLDLWRVLNNVKILRVFSQQEQIDVINGIEDHIRMTPRLRLIVIDSIALHFRHTYRDIAMRSRMLTGMAQTLRHVAEIHDIAIVITNQMTTKIVGKGTDEETALMADGIRDQEM